MSDLAHDPDAIDVAILLFEQIELLDFAGPFEVLAKAGLLDGREATTHHLGFERLAQLAPTCTVRANRRVVDTGEIVTSAGVAAGIDLGFHLIARFCGADLANATRCYVEA